MIESPKITKVQKEEDLKEINRKIVALGERFNKPVVGTCDVHFMNPEDEVYRRIIMAGKGFGDADNQPPLYLRTTDEIFGRIRISGVCKGKRDCHRESGEDRGDGRKDHAGASGQVSAGYPGFGQDAP